MKIEPSQFVPRVYSAEFPDGGWEHIVACEKLIFKGGPTDANGEGRILRTSSKAWKKTEAYDHVLFPCVIHLPLDGITLSPSRKAIIQFRKGGEDRNWTVSQTLAFGISEHAAACALSEAWLGVAECVATMRQLPRMKLLSKPLYKSKSLALWSMNAWLRWDHWNKAGYTLKRRAEILQGMGFTVSPKDIENAKAKRGMELPLKSEP